MGFPSAQMTRLPFLMPPFMIFPFCLFVLFFPNELYALLSLRTCLFSKQRQKRGASGWVGRWDKSGRSRGSGNCNQDMLHDKKNLFSITGRKVVARKI